MTPEVWQTVRSILERALEIEPEKRGDYLSEACGDDATLRSEVEALIAADENAAGEEFLARPAVEAAGLDSEASETSALGQRIGAYQVVEQVGHGGMGVVYRAVRADDTFRKEVAIKLARSGLGDHLATRRFKAERQILANLDHPHIARLLDGGSSEGRPYVVMEYVRGVPIDDYCDARKLPVRERLELFRAVCGAVAYAHQRLVIHRDIKPANILVTEEGQPKLLDFGIAKILDPREQAGDATVTLVRMMTPEYASPEQVRGNPISTATDVYSLGVVLYGLLTGRRPYRITSRSPHEIAQAVLEAEPDKPSTAIGREEAASAESVSRARGASPERLRRRLRGDLDNIVLKALRKEPERRYHSVEQFSEDIRRYLVGLPVIARPDTFAYRAGKFVRRHKAAVLAASLVVVALVGGIAATMREAYIARLERSRAEQRFSDVRELANSLLFEVHDAIENLPGSTPARKILVDRGLQYLDKLAKESGGDLSLQRELAAAYEKVGDVQGGYRMANLGDTAGFIASYRKALAIRKAVLEAEPFNVEVQRELIRTHGRLSDALTASGDPAGSLDQLRQLLPIAERLAAADPKNLADRRNLALAHLDYGWKSSASGGWQAGLEECRKAVSMLEAVASAEPGDKRTRRVLALAYGRLGELLSRYLHKHTDALALHEKALGLEQSLLAEDAHNTDLRRIAAWDGLRIGEELAAQGDTAGAQRRYELALVEMRELSRADPANALFHFDVASALARNGALHLDSGKFQPALSELQASLAEIAASSKPGAVNSDTLELTAMNQFRIAEAYRQMASTGKGPRSERIEYWRQAEAWYQRSLPDLTEASKRGVLEGDEARAPEIARAQMIRSGEEWKRLLANRP